MARRLIVLDGLRGLAALAVVFSHVADPGGRLGSAAHSSAYRALAGCLGQGRLGVFLFFVISGFCIHLRRARSVAEGSGTGADFASFWKRRFIRLYPAYVAALGLFVGFQAWTGAFAGSSFDWYNLIMHLTLLHNLDGRTVYQIDGVFWTLAVEEQLYLAYFLLLPLRDRLGWARTLAVCLGARLAWFGLAFGVGRLGMDFHLMHEGGSLAHWFTWALGAVCVESWVGRITLPAWAGRWRFAGLFALVAGGCDFVTDHHLGGGAAWRLTWFLGSPCWGLACFVLVNGLVRVESTWRAAEHYPRPVTLLAGLGLFSYSLYLTHNFVLKHLGPPILGWLGLADDMGGRALLVIPALIFAQGFFVLLERPCLNRAVRRGVEPDPPGIPPPLLDGSESAGKIGARGTEISGPEPFDDRWPPSR